MFRQFLASYRQWFETRNSIRMLEALDGHALADIGVSRGEIRNAVVCGRGA